MPRLAMPTSRDQRSAQPTPAREIARIAVPVSMEFVLMLVLNFVNQIVVGALGATAIAAVGFSNSLTFILAVTLGCLGTSVSILVARAHGAGRRDALDHTVTAALLVALGLGTVVSLVPWFFADHLMALVGASPSVAAAGTDYFRLTVLANSAIAYSLVVGLGPLPSLGVAGAGWATLVTAVVKSLILLWMAFGRRGVVGWSLPDSVRQWRAVIVPLFVLALPLGVTELFWTVGTFLYNVVFQKLGDE